MPLTNEQMQFFRGRLLQMKQETEQLLERSEHFGIESAMVNEAGGELSNYDNHPADEGTMLYEREKDVALNEHTEEQLEEIKQALGRIDQGTYGICEKCGKDIPIGRLEGHPTAARCVKHQADQFVSRKRPVEEGILRPPDGKFEYDEREKTMFDAEDAWQRVASWGTSETPSDFFEQAKLSYNDMYPEADEPNSSVEAIESFVDDDGEVIANADHEAYEEQMTDSE